MQLFSFNYERVQICISHALCALQVGYLMRTIAHCCYKIMTNLII